MKTKINPLEHSTESGTLQVMIRYSEGEIIEAADMYKTMYNINNKGGEPITLLESLATIKYYYLAFFKNI